VHTTDGQLPASPIVIYFESEDIDATVEQLKSVGLSFEQEPTDQDWLWREAYLLDPNCYRICLFHAGDNRKNPPWRVK
jgi:predicted enzyme related to lactoylglutathione lyase